MCIRDSIKGDEVNEENIATLLEGICPASVELNFNTCNCKAEKLIGILADYFKGKGVDAEKCYGSVKDVYKRQLGYLTLSMISSSTYWLQNNTWPLITEVYKDLISVSLIRKILDLVPM